MKLALAIFVCSGLYLCAVSLQPPRKQEIGDSEFERILEFVRRKNQNPPQSAYDRPKYHEFPKTKEAFLKDYQVYENVREDVDDEYGKFIKISENRMPYEKKYKWLKEPCEELLEADLDFKLKCILAFRTASEDREKQHPLTMYLVDKRAKVAYDVLEKQLEIFIKRLMDSGINDAAKDKLKEISERQDFLKFLGFWFNLENLDLGQKIEIMKRKDASLNDKAARVMIVLHEFPFL